MRSLLSSRSSLSCRRSAKFLVPVYHTLHHILTNPVYAGAYAFGRRGARVTIEGGRKHVVRSLRRKPAEWEVLIKDHHDGYVTLEEFERNQELIADNANGKSFLGRGSVRKGGALLPGLLRCAKCGRKLQVSYGSNKGISHRYACRGAFSERAETASASAECVSTGLSRVRFWIGSDRSA
jgi:Recombinase/Recombinase zinc beta ribbon domain